MFFPLIPLASSVLAALGLYGLWWYSRLSREDQSKADRLAGRYAMSLYHKGVAQLTRLQLSDVYSRVKSRHFDG